MVIDSSAVLALLFAEPESDRFVRAIAAADKRLLSAASYLEATIVMTARSGIAARQKLDRLIADLSIDIVPFTYEQALLGIEAFGAYGRGSGHPARLNFGDCFTYALAKLSKQPVLFKGDDFSRTDLPAAVPKSWPA